MDELIKELEEALERTHKHGEWNTRQAIIKVIEKYKHERDDT